MYLIVGLGNPGEKYIGTRHNVGFDVIAQIAEKYDIKIDYIKHKAICGKGMIEGNKVLLAQPLTYMNRSGDSIIELIKYYKISQEELIIIYDDISLDIGQLRIRRKGSAGGHNGIKSIINRLGTQEFNRIKVGVGNKPKEWDLADYVLSRFTDKEAVLISEAVDKAVEACTTITEKGIDYAMNLYNRNLK